MRKSVGFVLTALLLGGVACRKAAESPKKIPVTTTSTEARAAFLKGRDLILKLRSAEALPLLDEAISKDPNFALAHLLRAQTATSTREFFDHLKAAVAVAGSASEGEQWWIRGVEAGANGNTKERGDYYNRLVKAFPDDEDAHQLLGIHYYALQEYDPAIAEFQRAVQLAPNYAPSYNQMGYALRDAGKYQEAEAAFRKYVELIPNEPNPHDSLAELLMKMGRFDESIESYRKALSFNEQFLTAFEGIAANLMYQSKHKEALEQLQKEFDLARNDGERRRALVSMAVCNADEGKPSEALAKLSKAAAIAEQQGDKAGMGFHTVARADLLLNAGKTREAKAAYDKALELVRQSTVPDTVKRNFELAYHGKLALVAGANKDFENAKKEAETMRAGVEALGNPNQMKAAHEVLGIVSLQQKSYDEAISHLNQADLESPYTMFQLARAYAGKKDADLAKEWYRKTANAYILPDLNYAMVRKTALNASAK
ncbi:MAG TPA: tetratricopeptide repeat protein [Bryobacteraceae bacterium]|nr:tetratricopeptide repeat protein [Bryobacteraceae bacterium]